MVYSRSSWQCVVMWGGVCTARERYGGAVQCECAAGIVDSFFEGSPVRSGETDQVPRRASAPSPFPGPPRAGYDRAAVVARCPLSRDTLPSCLSPPRNHPPPRVTVGEGEHTGIPGGRAALPSQTWPSQTLPRLSDSSTTGDSSIHRASAGGRARRSSVFRITS